MAILMKTKATSKCLLIILAVCFAVNFVESASLKRNQIVGQSQGNEKLAQDVSGSGQFLRRVRRYSTTDFNDKMWGKKDKAALEQLLSSFFDETPNKTNFKKCINKVLKRGRNSRTKWDRVILRCLN
ncbi:unnamed protein product [Clavelina lepadiformis]|uniref:Uncharacterized protein n=1 Tax=Clavelina lepadiformis TaxID=159417 RepID=A0ABP0F1K8_CLALP